jgi:hypothetical protein
MDTMILKRIDRDGIRRSEEELRYQLKRDGHPLANGEFLVLPEKEYKPIKRAIQTQTVDRFE